MLKAESDSKLMEDSKEFRFNTDFGFDKMPLNSKLTLTHLH